MEWKFLIENGNYEMKTLNQFHSARGTIPFEGQREVFAQNPLLLTIIEKCHRHIETLSTDDGFELNSLPTLVKVNLKSRLSQVLIELRK